MGTQLPSIKRRRSHFSPIFGPCVLWPNGWMHQDGICYGDGPWSRPHGASWGTSSPPKKGTLPQFSTHLYCGQTAGWIKMPVGKNVGLGPGYIVLDGDPAPSHKKGTTPSFSSMSVVAKRMYVSLPVLVGLSLGDIVLNGDPVFLPLKGIAPNFRPMSNVAKWLYGLRCHLISR